MKLYKCTNVAFAAYLEMNGYTLIRIDIERQGKGVFYFDIADDVLNDIRCKWSTSNEAKFNDIINRMKSLTY
jgi:hypothetical protein